MYLPSSSSPTSSPAMTAESAELVNLPPEPFRLARQFNRLDLLEFDSAFGHEVVEIAVGRARYLRAIEIDLHRAAMILLGPGRRIADPIHSRRNPILLLIESLGNVFAGCATVLGGPVQRLFQIHRAANGCDIMHRTIGLAGWVRHFRDFHHRFHARRAAAP